MSISASGFFSRKRVGYSTLAVVVAIVAALAFYSIYRSPSSSATATRTVKVTKGTVQASVSASGNLSTVKPPRRTWSPAARSRHSRRRWREGQGGSGARER